MERLKYSNSVNIETLYTTGRILRRIFLGSSNASGGASIRTEVTFFSINCIINVNVNIKNYSRVAQK